MEENIKLPVYMLKKGVPDRIDHPMFLIGKDGENGRFLFMRNGIITTPVIPMNLVYRREDLDDTYHV